MTRFLYFQEHVHVTVHKKSVKKKTLFLCNYQSKYNSGVKSSNKNYDGNNQIYLFGIMVFNPIHGITCCSAIPTLMKEDVV